MRRRRNDCFGTKGRSPAQTDLQTKRAKSIRFKPLIERDRRRPMDARAHTAGVELERIEQAAKIELTPGEAKAGAKQNGWDTRRPHASVQARRRCDARNPPSRWSRYRP